MADQRAKASIDSILHEKMKRIVKEKGGARTLLEEYNQAVENHIANYYQEEIIKDSLLEKTIQTEIKKIDKHLSSMLGRSGMDISMILVGIIEFLADYFEKDFDEMSEELRKTGAKYYTRKE